MDKAAEFVKLFQKHGAKLDTSKLTSQTKGRYKGLIDFYNYIDPNIYVDVIDNPSFNAIATKQNGQEYIALYSGAFTHLTLYAYNIFSDPEMFPSIGDSSVEKVDEPLKHNLKTGSIHEFSDSRYLPNDPIRTEIADRIAECACLILFLHEAAHIRGCHLDIIYDELNVTEHKEITAIPLDEKESLFLRAIELEADTLAIANSLTIWRLLCESSTGHKSVHTIGVTNSWFIATQLLFWSISFSHYSERHDLLSSHPSTITRLFNTHLFRGYYGKEDKEIIDAHANKENFLTPWIKKNRFPSSILDSFPSDPSEEIDCQEYYDIQNKLQELWPKIEKLEAKRTLKYQE